MSKGPGLFTDIGKKAKDLLNQDYISDQKVTISSVSDTGVIDKNSEGRGKVVAAAARWLFAGSFALSIADFLIVIPREPNINKVDERDTFFDSLFLTSSTVKKGGLTSGDVGLKYAYKNTLADVKIDTQSSIAATFGFTDIAPSTKTILSLKYPDHNSSKVEVQYFHHHGTFTTVVGLNQTPAFDVSATIGTPTFAFGAEAGYDTTSGVFSKYSAGFSVNKPESNASIILGDKGDSIRGTYVHHLDKSSAVAEITRKFSTNENTVTVGGLYALDSLTLLKAKLNNHGKLGVVLQHQVIPKSMLTISSEFDTKALDKTPRFGLGLALKP